MSMVEAKGDRRTRNSYAAGIGLCQSYRNEKLH